MISQVFLYIGAAITFLWGVSHLYPTANIVKGFGEISADNKNIITMEWIVEAVALIFIGVIVAGVTLIDAYNNVSTFIYIASSVVLIVLAVVSLFTGFKVNFLPFKLCPVLFTLSAVLIFIGQLS
jgi:FlaA1/EpsC-like NDP-sugar epimerase